MEHPAPPKDGEKASVWRVPSHRHLLMTLPRAAEHYIEQWRFGSKGCKPTIIRALNVGDESRTQHLLRSAELPAPVRPQRPLIGRDDANKQFRTAEANEYPRQLSFALANTLLVSLKRRAESEGFASCTKNLSTEEVDWIDAVEREAQSFKSGTFLPDFQGWDRESACPHGIRLKRSNVQKKMHASLQVIRF